MQIPGNPLRSFDISWVNPTFSQYYLGDRSNAGIDVVNTASNTFTLRLTGFVGIVLNANGAVNNAKSGPDGVTAHGRWVYGGDGNSTLKVFNIFAVPTVTNGVPGIAPAQSIPTGGTTRVDEMALTTDGKLLLAANNAEDPPFATLFAANGDSAVSNVSSNYQSQRRSDHHSNWLRPVVGAADLGTQDQALLCLDPDHRQQSRRLQLWADCHHAPTPINCDGGMLVIDPTKPTAVLGAFDPNTNTGVVPLNGCSPNGATVGPGSNLLLGCTPATTRATRPPSSSMQTTRTTPCLRHHRLRRSLVQFRRPALLHRLEQGRGGHPPPPSRRLA